MALKPMLILDNHKIVYLPPYSLRPRDFTWAQVDKLISKKISRSSFSELYISGERKPISLNADSSNYLEFLKYIVKKIGEKNVSSETLNIICDKNSKKILSDLKRESKIAIYSLWILMVGISLIMYFLPS